MLQVLTAQVQVWVQVPDPQVQVQVQVHGILYNTGFHDKYYISGISSLRQFQAAGPWTEKARRPYITWRDCVEGRVVE